MILIGGRFSQQYWKRGLFGKRIFKMYREHDISHKPFRAAATNTTGTVISRNKII